MAKRDSETVTDESLEGLEELDTTQDSVEVVESDLEPLETVKDDTPTLVTPHPRPRGGVRSDGGIPGTTKLDRYTPVPPPRYRKFLSTAENPHQNSRSAWKYWMALPDWAKGQIDAYIYRDHPILLEPPIDEETGKPKYLSSIDKIPGTDPITDDLDLLNRYGCGSYHVYLSETASPKKTDKSICQIWVQNVGSNNYRSNPPTDPRVTDVDQVDLDHPANKAYVSYLRAEGRLPEQIDGKVKEHEMATIEAVKEVTSQQGTLVKEIIGMARERGQSSDTSAKVQAEVMADASKRSHEMTTEAAKQSISMVREAFDQAKAMLPTVATPAPTADPVTTALALIDAIKKSSHDGGSSAEVLDLRNQLNQFLQRQIDSQQKQIELLMEAKVTNPAASTSPFAAMKEGLESLEQFNGVMERLRGGKDEGEDAVVDAVADAAPKWMRPILPILPGLAQGLLGWLQTRNQQPQVAYYQAADGRILPIAQPQVMAPPQPQIQGPTPIRPSFGPQPVPSPAPNPAQSPDPIYTLLSSISLPFLNYLEANGTGTDFADWFIGGYGEQVYDDVVQLGPDTLFTAVSTFPPISTHEIYAKTPVEQVQALINDFCDPKWPEEEGIEKGTEAGTGPGPGPIPA